MSNIRTLAFRLIRTYASKPFTKAAGIRGKRAIDIPDDSEEVDYDDLDAYTSDFLNVGESHKMHEREMERSRERLKQRIVKSKYFKEVEPKFLTFMEKNQIQKLHESDPEEWTPETLSKSFPALPDTIRSVLKAKWVPKSIDRVVKYDTEVVKNWKNFKSGRLVVSPILREHLMKFKNRKITVPTREELSETIVLPKVEFQKPRSTMFSNIFKSTMKEKQPVHDQKLISSKSEIDRNKEILFDINEDDSEKSMVQVNKSNCMKIYIQKTVANGKLLTFNEFMKLELTRLYEKSPEEGITLLQTYRKYVEAANLEVVQSKEPTNLEAVKSEEFTNLEAVKSEESTNLEAVKSEEFTNLEAVKSEEFTNLEAVKSEEFTNLEPVKSEEFTNLEPVKSEEFTNLEAVKSEEFTNLEPVKSVEPSNLEAVKSEESSNLEAVESEEPTNLEVVESEESNNLEAVEYEEFTNLEAVKSEEFTNLEAVKSEEFTNLEAVKSEEFTNLEAVESEEPTNLEAVESEESTNLKVVQSEELSDSVKQVNKENITPTKNVSTENVPVVVENETQTEVANALNTERSSGLDTYVKHRKTDIDTKFEYTKPIKIPKNVWKEGMTYRVKDCYYDDDGEFLYRVPGLRLY